MPSSEPCKGSLRGYPLTELWSFLVEDIKGGSNCLERTKWPLRVLPQNFQKEFCWGNYFSLFAEVRSLLTKFIHHYNHTRTRQALNYQTPN